MLASNVCGVREHTVGKARWRAETTPPRQRPPAQQPQGAGRGRPGLAGARRVGRLPGRRGGERLFTQEGCADSTFLEFTLLSLSLL